jgi:hypothetical protein
MESTENRRCFLKHCVLLGGACSALLASEMILSAQEGAPAQSGQAKKPIDLKSLAYCGIPNAFCEQKCELYKATRDHDDKLKKTVYEQWEMKKKFGIEFDPDKIFCHTCKPGNKPLKIGMAECPVRTCPMKNGMESCVQCLNLASCDKAFWKEWPIAYDAARTLQARYKEQPGAIMKDVKSD